MAYQIFSDMSCLFPYSLYFYHHIEKHDVIMKTQFCKGGETMRVKVRSV